MKWFWFLREPVQAHASLQEAWVALKPYILAGHRFELTIETERRSSEQNSAQWPILDAFAKQLQWPVNGHMVYMTADDWKDVLTAAFKREQVRLAAGLDGGFVMLGLRTSKMSKDVFGEWLDFLKATAALRGVEIGEGVPA